MIPKYRFFGEVADGTMRMVMVDSIDFKNEFVYYSYHVYTVEGDDYVCGDTIALDDCVVMQSTGLKDKNGVEIFDGDIVLLHHFTLEYAEGGGAFEGEDELKGIIKLTRPLEDIVGKAYPSEWVLSTEHEYLSINLIEGIHEESFEVLGNRWENPELVEDD